MRVHVKTDKNETQGYEFTTKQRKLLMNKSHDSASSSSEDAKLLYQLRHMVGFFLTILVIGLLTAAFFARSWETFWGLVMFGTGYAAFLLWPVLFVIASRKPPEE